MEDECFVPPLIRILLCPCNAGACRLITSHSAANPDRQFFKCPEPQQCRHGRFGKDFFKWADQVRADEMIDVRVPYCGGCMAGPCRVQRETTWPNSGKILFTCTVKEGQGSCGYRIYQDEFEMSLREQAKDTRVSVDDCNATDSPDIRPVGEERGSENLEVTSPPVSLASCYATASPGIWPGEEDVGREKLEVTMPLLSLDKCNATASPDLLPVEEEAEGEKLEVASPQESLAYCHATASTNNGVVEKIGLGERLEDVQLQSPSISTSRRPRVRRTVSRKKMKQSKFQEDDNTIPLRTPLKRSRNGNKVLAFSVSGNPHMLHLVKNFMMLRQQWWMAVAMHKNLGSQLQGWLGRLAFYPLPKPMIYVFCVVPSRLDAEMVVQEEKLVNPDASPNLLISLPESESALLDPLIVQNDKPIDVGASAINGKNTPDSMARVEKTRINNVISESVSKVFVQAAEKLQGDLITFLEKMDFKDHQAMMLEAEAAFTALDRLGIEHQYLDKRVSEFISCSRTLAAVEQFMPKSDTYPEMELCHKFERMKLDKMESAHLASVDTLIRSKESLSALRDLINSAKEWLYLMEIEYLCCDAELGKMESQLEKNSEEKLVLEKKYLDASKELEGSMKFHEQRGAAKAAFDRAKASLRR